MNLLWFNAAWLLLKYSHICKAKALFVPRIIEMSRYAYFEVNETLASTLQTENLFCTCFDSNLWLYLVIQSKSFNSHDCFQFYGCKM